jgi:hypothetical protein
MDVMSSITLCVGRSRWLLDEPRYDERWGSHLESSSLAASFGLSCHEMSCKVIQYLLAVLLNWD